MKNEESCDQDDELAPAAGSKQTLAELYRRHSRGVHEFLLGMLRDRADADEALQQVFLKLLEAWESVQPETAKG